MYCGRKSNLLSQLKGDKHLSITLMANLYAVVIFLNEILQGIGSSYLYWIIVLMTS